MSVHEAAAATPADHGVMTIEPDGSPVWVDHGVADVFANGASGNRFLVATITAGHAAFPLPIPLMVVPRLDTAVTTTAPEGADPQAHWVAFLAVVKQTLGEALELESDQTVTAQTLATAISTAIGADEATRAANFQASLRLTEDRYSASLDRMAYSGHSLQDPIAPADANPLVAVLTILGAHEGFAVVAPTKKALGRTRVPLKLIAHTSGVRFREVHLAKGWTRDSTSSYLAALDKGDNTTAPVAVLKLRNGYAIQGAEDPSPLPLTDELAARLEPQVFEFYRPLTPDRAATVKDVLRMGLRGSGSSWWLAAVMAFGIAMLGLLTPTLTNLVVGSIIPQGDTSLMIQVGLALVVAAGVAFTFSLVQNFTVSVISQRATMHMQSAFWDRVLSLPASFFRDFSSGDLTVRILAVDTLSQLVSTQVVSAVLAAVFGLVNFFLMFQYDMMLGFAGLLIILLTVLVLALATRSLSKYATHSLRETRQANGWLVQMLSGIMKIRLSHAENRMEAEYFDIARRQAIAMSRQTVVSGRVTGWFTFISAGASALFYLVVLLEWEGSGYEVTSATFLAFTSAYGLAFAAMTGLSALIGPIANAGPTFNLLRPIMEALPENAGGKDDPGVLSGHIELRDVRFRYTEDGPLVLRGLDLDIPAGSMVALVGSSGAGKSTITRLLLGFDAPESGQVMYDGRDFKDLDPALVRSQMGVVVQNGKITRGSIMKNILGSASQDEELAWAAAEKAAMAEEIEAMPMKMQTVIDPGNISGGQAQRILLARALVRNPRILILDEATSALDNTSQAIVTKAMNELAGTRIVIAHRLSTIMSADKIIVMDKGRAVESGTFDELMAKDGVFTALVKRQTA